MKTTEGRAASPRASGVSLGGVAGLAACGRATFEIALRRAAIGAWREADEGIDGGGVEADQPRAVHFHQRPADQQRLGQQRGQRGVPVDRDPRE